MFTFCKKYGQFSILNKKRKKNVWTFNMIIEWMDKIFCSKCKFWECSRYKRAKAQLFKETWISRWKYCFDLQLMYSWVGGRKCFEGIFWCHFQISCWYCNLDFWGFILTAFGVPNTKIRKNLSKITNPNFFQ